MIDSDIRQIDIGGIELKQPFYHTPSGKATLTITKISVGVHASGLITYVGISEEFCRAIEPVDLNLGPEDRNRIDWLISMARSMM